MMHPVTLVFLTYRTWTWAQVVRALIDDSGLDREVVRVIDVAKFTSPSQIAMGRSQLREILGVDVTFLEPGRGKNKDSGSVDSPGHAKQVLLESIDGHLQTYFQDDVPPRHWIVKLHASRVERMASQLHSIVSAKTAERFNVRKAYVPNGRFPSEVAIAEALRGLSVPLEFFELSATKTSYFTSTMRIHEPVAETEQRSQLKADERITAQTQLLRSKSVNPEILLNQKRPSSKSEEPLALFLTSSTDELGAYAWLDRNSVWQSQYEAFASVLDFLRHTETRFVLRIHPNLQLKSHNLRSREIKVVRNLASRYPDLEVIYDWDSRSTHQLIMSSSRVFTSLSTAGLESSALGKPVWVTMRNSWSDFVDVRHVEDRASINKENLEPWPVNPDPALARLNWLQDRNLDVPALLNQQPRKKILRKLRWLTSQSTVDLMLFAVAKPPLFVATVWRKAIAPFKRALN